VTSNLFDVIVTRFYIFSNYLSSEILKMMQNRQKPTKSDKKSKNQSFPQKR